MRVGEARLRELVANKEWNELPADPDDREFSRYDLCDNFANVFTNCCELFVVSNDQKQLVSRGESCNFRGSSEPTLNCKVEL